MFDAHLHLQDARLDACRDAVVTTAQAAGVRSVCCCGTHPNDWKAVASLADAYRNPDTFFVLPAFGVHPWHAETLPQDWVDTLEHLLRTHASASVGEIGLDGLRHRPDRETQRRICLLQLELAVRMKRPVVLHGARAWGDLLETIRPFAGRLPGFVAHAFSGSKEMLREWVALGAYISFAGSVCNPNASHVRAAVETVPSDRLLIETDSPDMLPLVPRESMTGERDEKIPHELNHPANLIHIVRTVAEIRSVSIDEIAALTVRNARVVYGMV